MLIETHIYRKAFLEYVRRGTPIHLSIKQQGSTTHYVWRTQRDRKVRSTHAAREGEIFAWNNPPPGGHPGEEYGCRCTAEPYLPEIAEFVVLTLKNISDSGSAWSSADFVDHYYTGNGRGVTVRETGHLSDVVDAYMSEVEERLQEQIVAEARSRRNDSLRYPFVNTYGMTWVVFSIGDTTIGGTFTGSVEEEHGILSIDGGIEFYLKDEFADPVGLGIELGGDPYPITDKWSAELQGKVYLDASRSTY